MEMTTNAISWFEIPVSDFDRAKEFYGTIFDFDMPVMDMGGTRMGMLLHDQGSGIGGAIVHGEDFVPSTTGSLVYLNGGADLSVVLGRVTAAGGSVLMPKTDIGSGFGNFALFIDTEGNKVGLHSMG
jgi:predicted enzyme related to lactoylglutathione lyase